MFFDEQVGLGSLCYSPKAGHSGLLIKEEGHLMADAFAKSDKLRGCLVKPLSSTFKPWRNELNSAGPVGSFSMG